MSNDERLAPPTPLFISKRFLPLFLVQFLGALNDNLFRNAIFVLVTFKLAQLQGIDAPMIVSIGAGLFILPFFLFSATAGAVVDRFQKARLVRTLKLIEFVLIIGAAVGLYIENTHFMLFVLFLLGVQAAFFGPIKYSILPQLVAPQELVSANGYVEGGTFLAILAGTIGGSIGVTLEDGPLIISVSMVGLGLVGWLISFGIPQTKDGDRSVVVPVRFLKATWPLLRESLDNRSIRLSVLGISWFWFVGAIFLSVLPNYVKDTLNGDEHLVTYLLTLFSIGIAAGSVSCSRFLKGRIDARHVPLGGIVMSIAIFVLYAISRNLSVGSPITVLDFVSLPRGLGISLSLFLLAFAGGIFTVPLYAIMQARSDDTHRARVIAANNVVNSIFMVVSSLFTLGMFAYGCNVTDIFLITAIISALVALYVCKLLPQPVSKAVFRTLLRVLYRVQIRGIENLETVKDKGAVFIVNHTSLIDGILLAAFLPDFPTFAVNTHVARSKMVQLFLSLVDHHLIDPTNPMALKSLVEVVNAGRHVVIFPEGRITMTGSLMKIYEGPGIIAVNAKAPVVPVRINGAQYTPFSYLRGKVRTHLFPIIDITILPPVILEPEEGVTSRQRRKSIGAQLYDVMSDMMFSTCNINSTLYKTFLDARKINGPRTPIIEDIERHPLSYDRLLLASRVLGRKFSKFTAKKEIVGVLLPNSTTVASVFFGLLACGRIPAMLNFTSGLSSLQSACKAAEIKNVLTSRRFIALAKLEPLMDGLSGLVKVIYMEDVGASIGVLDKIVGFITARSSSYLYDNLKISPDDTAVVLFTSGSEGVPKGVALSHKNILANRYQLSARIDFTAADIVFNPLPVFHSFGLTGGLLLPILSGVRTFLYPSPLHYRIISELVYDTNATIMFGTDTFLAGYARMANAYDFYSVRYVFSGAERVKEETRRAWQDKFGLRIFEGYGATETSPVLSINTPMHAKAGTVGRLLPSITYTLEPVPGIEKGGRLIVKGPNVMQGYLKHDKPGILQAPEDQRYDTGDIVEVDALGFVTIVGRVKRFAKIAGEMISLNAVETYIQAIQPDQPVAVVSIPHEKKGEELVVFTTLGSLTRDAILAAARTQNLPELMIPRQIVKIDALPVLGTGKTDYVSLNNLARTQSLPENA